MVPTPDRTTGRGGATIELDFDELTHEHAPTMLRYAIRLTGDLALAEDIVQEALLRAWQHRDTVGRLDGATRGWLCKVVRNLVIDQARARRSRPVVAADPPPSDFVDAMALASHQPGARACVDIADAVVDRVTIEGALQYLPAAHRDVLLELYWGGRTIAEAAEILAIPAGTVKSRAFYAIRALREVLDSK